MSSRRNAGRDPLDSITIHIGDWCTSLTVARLGRAGEATYLRLLMHQWLAEGEGLPADEGDIQALTGLSDADFAAFWRIAGGQFPVDPDGKRRNLRTHVEWQHCRDTREMSRARAKKGGESKAAKEREARCLSGAQAVLKHMPEHSSKHAPSPSPARSSSNEEDDGGYGQTSPLAASFVDPSHRGAYERARRAARVPESLDASLSAMASGLGGIRGKPLTWHQIGTALVEVQAANAPTTPNVIRGFAAKVSAEPIAQPTLFVDPPGVARDRDGNIIRRAS